MGHKINPYGFRLGVTTDWKAKWFAEGKQFIEQLHSDVAIREYIRKRLRHASISRIEIERKGERMRVEIHTARPGVVIGRKGAEVEALKQELVRMTGLTDVRVDAFEISDPSRDAQVVSQQIAEALQGRVMFRRAMKRAVGDAMRAGAQGVKVQCSGRLGGAEMSRREYYREGQVPLTTLRADLEYGFYEAKTKYGVIGVKVWIYNGEVLPEVEAARQRQAARERINRRRTTAPRRRTGGRGPGGRSDAPPASEVESKAPEAEAVVDAVAAPVTEAAPAPTPEVAPAPEAQVESTEAKATTPEVNDSAEAQAPQETESAPDSDSPSDNQE